MASRVWYTTLDLAKVELEAESTADDDELRTYIDAVCTRVDQVLTATPRPYFAPYQEQRRVPLMSKRLLDGGLTYSTLFPLQSVSEVLLESTDKTSDVEIDHENQGTLRWIGASSNFANELANHAKLSPRLNITGVWGFHRDYANAWLDSGDTVQDNPLSTSATTLTVSASSAFEEGQMLQIESEWLLIEAIPSGTTLTVKRGIHGTTAAEHVQDTQIDIYVNDEVLERLCARQVALWYARQGAFQDKSFDGIGVVSYPPDLLEELTTSLRELTYVD